MAVLKSNSANSFLQDRSPLIMDPSSSDSSDTFSGSDTDKEVAEPPKKARKRSRSATAVGSGPHRRTSRRHSVHQSGSPIGHKEEQDAGQHLEGSPAEVQVSIYVCC